MARAAAGSTGARERTLTEVGMPCFIHAVPVTRRATHKAEENIKGIEKNKVPRWHALEQ